MGISVSRRQFGLSVLVPTARALFPKRGNLGHLIEPLASALPINEVVVAGKWDSAFVDSVLPQGVRLTLIAEDNVERAHLRNVAATAATETHLLLLDDDTIVVPRRRLVTQALKLPPRSMLTLAKRCYLGMTSDLDSFYAQLKSQRWSLRYCKGMLRAEDSWREKELYGTEITFASNFSIISRETYLDLGGFDESMTGWGYEDVDLMNRVLKGGDIMACRATATAIHIDHLVAPNRECEAFANYLRFVRKCKQDIELAPYSSSFYGIAARFIPRIVKYSPPTSGSISNALRQVYYCAANETDRHYLVRRLLADVDGLDLLGLAVYGSAAHTAECGDIDLCAIVGYGPNRFASFGLPSGLRVEVHTLPLQAISSQISGLPYMGEQAYWTYGKWKSLRFVYDYEQVCSHYINLSLQNNHHVLPFMMSYYAGVAWLAYDRCSRSGMATATLEMSVDLLARVAGAESSVDGRESELVSYGFFLRRLLRVLAPQYERLCIGVPKASFMVYPPNFIGDKLLKMTVSHSTNKTETMPPKET